MPLLAKATTYKGSQILKQTLKPGLTRISDTYHALRNDLSS
jgi:hypothetical protein